MKRENINVDSSAGWFGEETAGEGERNGERSAGVYMLNQRVFEQRKKRGVG